MLSDRRRCELALRTALDAIDASAAAEARLVDTSIWVFQQLFPFDLLDLELPDAALQTAVRERIESRFDASG